jgi:response regulator of citrate/malate metabolism
MIRTLIVDDDAHAAAIHRSFAERVDGFEVVGEAHTGAAAIELVRRLQPDLVLLDIYLPDLGGLEVMRRVRERDQRVDFIAITSAKDVQTLRGAMHGGVVHYLVKPFRFAMFREKLDSFAALRSRFERMVEADQEEIDTLYGLLRSQRAGTRPKGISAPTLKLLAAAVQEADKDVSVAEVAQRTNLSPGTARRYLDFLIESGAVELTFRYGSAGRPEHLFRWRGTVRSG